MDETLDSMLMMRNQGLAQLAGGNASPSLLDEIRDLAIAEMSEVFALVLERATTELLEMAGRNPSHVMYCLYMDAREQTLNHQKDMVSAFRQHLFQHFNEARRRGQAVAKPGPRFDESELNLVEPEELELTLASSTMGHALRVASHEELPGLERRMGLLLDDMDLKLGPNPLGPERIGETMMEAINVLPTGNKVKLMLVTRLNTHLPPLVGEVYQKINRLLVARGVLPSIKLEIKRPRGGAAPQTPAQAAGQAQPEEEAKPQQDMFAMLQQLMSMGRIGGGGTIASPNLPSLPGSPSAEAANEGEMDSGQVVERLTQFQHGDVSGVSGVALDSAILGNGQVNVLRAIKNTGAAGNMGHMDAMTLDIVALMFDYILDDPRLPDGMKALIGRLQIPVLKVAMLDKTFFSQKAHPARRLLDTLADAALGWDEQEGHDSSLYKTVDGLIQRVLNEYEDKVDVFADVLETLQAFMADEKRLADERACLSAQILQSNEQAGLAHTVSLEAVQARLLDSDAPEFIHHFLQGPWVSHLSGIYAREGEQGDGWKQAMNTLGDLLWSLSPKTTKDERQKLVALLPRLLKQLDTGIQAAALPRAERDRFFADLVKYHALAVKPDGQSSQATAPRAASARPVMRPPPLPPSFAFDGPDLHDIPSPSPAARVEADPQILREISTPDRQEGAEEILIGDVIGQERLATDIGEEENYDELVLRLKRGTWIEFKLEDDSALRAKLAWVSPLRGTYLFTNRLGERAVSINAAGLAGKLREGSARIVDSVALIDRAVSSLFEKLQKSPSPT